METITPPSSSNPTPSKYSCLGDNCADLILETYIRICLDGDHSRLGEGDTEAAWAKIQAEFETLTGGTTHLTVMRLSNEINHLAAKLDLIYSVTEEMRKYFIPAYGEVLKGYGFNYEWFNVDEETYEKQLTAVESQSKRWYVQLQAKKKEWDDLVKSNSKDVKITRGYFEDWIVELSSYNGYPIDPNNTSTYRFAVMIKRRNANPNKSADTNKK